MWLLIAAIMLSASVQAQDKNKQCKGEFCNFKRRMECFNSFGYAYPRGYKLIFSDEFNGPNGSLPDPDKWTYEDWEPKTTNEELQRYTVNRTENARIENGKLTIEARQGPAPDAFTSARLVSRGKFDFQYGLVEWRAKVPQGRGTWPALWLLPLSMGVIYEWPLCGEMDVMEHVGQDMGNIWQGIHSQKYNFLAAGQGLSVNQANIQSVKNVDTEYHIYRLEWTPEFVSFSIDGELLSNKFFHNDGTGQEAWPFDQKFYLVMNNAVGGIWAGLKGIDFNVFPAPFFIDYVRVYQAFGGWKYPNGTQGKKPQSGTTRPSSDHDACDLRRALEAYKFKVDDDDDDAYDNNNTVLSES